MTDGSNRSNGAMDGERGDVAPADGGRAEKRSPHSIRFLEPEWERIEAYAETRGLTGPEFVRFAALAAMETGSPPFAAGDRLAPLIEMTFRATYIIATKMRDEMLDAGRKEELDELVAAARGLQDEILGSEPVEENGWAKAGSAGGGGERGSGCRQERNLRPAATIHSCRAGGTSGSSSQSSRWETKPKYTRPPQHPAIDAHCSRMSSSRSSRYAAMNSLFSAEPMTSLLMSTTMSRMLPRLNSDSICQWHWVMNWRGCAFF